MDLFASFRQPDGSWSEPATSARRSTRRPSTSAPGLGRRPILFFLSQRGGESHTWWVEARVIGACQRTLPGPPPAADLAVIEKVIRDNIGWALTKDRSLLESTLAQDERLFIFNPTPRSRSDGAVRQGVRLLDGPPLQGHGVDIRDLRIDVSFGGTAWWSCILDDLGEWDGQPIGWKDTRWTGVLEKRDGNWLIVQMHFSFAADKVAAEVKAKLAHDEPSPAKSERKEP